MLTEPETEVVNSRLTQKVTCAFKGTALSDLCEKMKADTGIQLTAGPRVADEKVTLFCERLPLREVMRQLSRPFGYTWLRSRQGLGPGRVPVQVPTPVYRYELVQDLRSQLLEEELRNRDRNAALVALEQEIERYRPYGSAGDRVLWLGTWADRVRSANGCPSRSPVPLAVLRQYTVIPTIRLHRKSPAYQLARKRPVGVRYRSSSAKNSAVVVASGQYSNRGARR